MANWNNTTKNSATFINPDAKHQTEFLATEALDFLITESGDYLITGVGEWTAQTKN